MNKKILSQGHFDGFCLLYSILNSYKTLLKPNQSSVSFSSDNSCKWKKIIGIAPSLQNFASGEGSDFGVSKDQTDNYLKERFISDCFSVLTEGMKINITSEREQLENIKDVDFEKSVIILCVNEKAQLEHGAVGDHWISIVGINKDESKYLVACSFTNHGQEDAEKVDSKTSRVYNNALSFSELKKSKVYVHSIQKVLRLNT
jgi:hypothetical protein